MLLKSTRSRIIKNNIGSCDIVFDKFMLVNCKLNTTSLSNTDRYIRQGPGYVKRMYAPLVWTLQRDVPADRIRLKSKTKVDRI